MQQGCGSNTSLKLGAKRSKIFIGLVSIDQAFVCVPVWHHIMLLYYAVTHTTLHI